MATWRPENASEARERPFLTRDAQYELDLAVHTVLAGGTVVRTWRQPNAPAALVYVHGNGEDVGLVSPWCATLAAALDVDVVAVDFEGCGPFVSRKERSSQSDSGCARLSLKGACRSR